MLRLTSDTEVENKPINIENEKPIDRKSKQILQLRITSEKWFNNSILMKKSKHDNTPLIYNLEL